MKRKNNFKCSLLVILFSAVLFEVALNSSSKLANASTDKLSDIENQIVTLKGLNYSPKHVKKIIEMTNDDVTFYIEDYNDKIVIGKLDSSDNVNDITVIDFKN